MERSFIKLRNTNKFCAKTDLFGVLFCLLVYWFCFGELCVLLFFFNKGKIHVFKDTGNDLIYIAGTSADRDHLLSGALFVCTFKPCYVFIETDTEYYFTSQNHRIN